ncbi:GTP cyclohydrolase I FolE [Ferrimonas pelagia]
MISDYASTVRSALEAAGLETPLRENGLDRDQKRHKIEGCMAEIMDTLGLDRRDDSLMQTPARIAKMYVDEIFCGLDYAKFPKLTVIDNKMGVDEMITVSDVAVISTCEHHFITIDGTAKVAYIPDDKIIGLSKINRIVRFFSQRPQVQERLTRQLLISLQTLLGTENVAVSINAIHYCVKSRGVMDANSHTTTTALGGTFKADPRTRSEFLSL